MTPLAPTHPGTPPPLAEPHAEEPRSRVGRRLLDLDDQPIRFPSDRFVGRDTITVGEWRRRHERTYGEHGTAEFTVFVLLCTGVMAALLVAFLSGALDQQLGSVLP